MELRVDDALGQAFAEAARREHVTTADALRHLMQHFVRDGQLKEARRQSRLVATASDAEETMDVLMRAQRLSDDRPADDRKRVREGPLQPRPWVVIENDALRFFIAV